MKSLKKVLAIVLALVMVCSFAVPAFASAGGYDITINGAPAGHTFKAYQILKGTVTGEQGDKSLEDPAWGADVTNTAAFVAELASAFEDSSIKDAASLAKFLNAKQDDSEVAIKFAKIAAKYVQNGTAFSEIEGTYSATGLDAGYYLVIDESELDGAEADANSRYILKVVNNVSTTAKIAYPDVEKDVLDKNDSDKLADTENEGWGKSADHDIGDEVEFKLTGTIPDTTGYNKYYYAFHDKMDTRLKLDARSFEVTVGGVKLTDGYEVKTPKTGQATFADGCTFEVIIKDLIAAIDSVKDNEDPAYSASKGVVVTNKAVLTEDARIGLPGQENEVQLEFSNNPNWTGKGKGDKPENPDEPDESTSSTEPEEPEEPTGRTKWKKVVVFTYDLTVNKTDYEGNPLTGAEFTLEKFVEDAEGTPDETLGKTGNWVTVRKVISKDGNKFMVKGLDDGNYRLTETTAPTGYNPLAEPIYFVITAGHSMEPKTLTVTVDKETFTVTETDTRSISTDVKNSMGVELPETGGIGTTVFYIAGGLIVLFAAVMLIAKRRMKNVA